MGYRLYWPAGVSVSARVRELMYVVWIDTRDTNAHTHTCTLALIHTHTLWAVPFTLKFAVFWNVMRRVLSIVLLFSFFFFLPLSFFSFLSSFFVFFSLLGCYLPSSGSVNFLHISAIRQMRKFFCLSTFFYEQIKVASHYPTALRAMHLMTSTKTFADVVAAANPGTHLFCFYLLGGLTCSMPHALLIFSSPHSFYQKQIHPQALTLILSLNLTQTPKLSLS